MRTEIVTRDPSTQCDGVMSHTGIATHRGVNCADMKSVGMFILKL